MSIDFETSVNHSAQIKQKMAPQHASHPEMDHKTSESASVPQGISPKDSVASSPATSFDSLSSLSPQYIEEPMMTGDRYSEPMDLSDDSNYGMNLQSPQQMNGNTLSSNALKELKNSLDKDGVLGQSLANGYVSEGGSTMVQRRNSAQTLEDVENANLKNGEFDNFSCHICSFQGTSKEEYNQHMPCHFTYKCPICDYTSRTRGRLTRHISDFHSETPPESWARRNDTNADKEKGKEKSKTLKCKQCGFTCNSKQEYYGHLRTTHMDAERVLKCPHCYFVTMYKHHFEYHLRNHVGLKPFRCNKCNYSCVNKSMLNSHKKSHSQIYPFRCGSCTYASKYCHSLKIHLRKYLHKPGQTLNADGTPNNNSIDVYGRRRGPKSKKAIKAIKAKSAPTSKALVCTQSSAIAETVPDQQYSTQYFQPTNSFPSIFMGSSAMGIQFPSFPAWAPRPFKCRYCDFVTDSLDLYQQHVVSHASRENPDLIRTYNISINPEVFHLQAQHLTFNNFPQNPIQYANNSPQVEHRNDTQFSSVPSSTITGENSQLSSSPDQVHGKRSDDSPPKNNKIKQSPSTREETLANNLLTIGLATQYSSISKEFKKMDISNDYCYTSNVNEFKNNTSLNTAPDAVTLESFSISPKPSTMYSARELVEISDNSLDNSIGRHSPLDLSKTKYSLAYQANELHNLISMKSIQNGTSEHPTQNKTLEHPTQNRTSIPRSDSCTPSRNRRKGKAFKLDQFIKSDESPIKTNFGGTGLVGGSEKPKKSLINRKRKDSSSLMNSLWTNTSPDTGEERYKSPIVSLYFNGHGTPSPKKFATNRSRTSSPDQSENAARTSPACSSYSNDLAIVPKLEPGCIENNATQPEPSDNSYTCKFCEMDFKDCAMYTMHMGYHGYGDPYTCNKCGIMCGDKVEFFLHLVRVAHL